jgi:SAM-dependent methyltransferase
MTFDEALAEAERRNPDMAEARVPMSTAVEVDDFGNPVGSARAAAAAKDLKDFQTAHSTAAQHAAPPDKIQSWEDAKAAAGIVDDGALPLPANDDWDAAVAAAEYVNDEAAYADLKEKASRGEIRTRKDYDRLRSIKDDMSVLETIGDVGGATWEGIKGFGAMAGKAIGQIPKLSKPIVPSDPAAAMDRILGEMGDTVPARQEEGSGVQPDPEFGLLDTVSEAGATSVMGSADILGSVFRGVKGELGDLFLRDVVEDEEAEFQRFLTRQRRIRVLGAGSSTAALHSFLIDEADQLKGLYDSDEATDAFVDRIQITDQAVADEGNYNPATELAQTGGAFLGPEALLAPGAAMGKAAAIANRIPSITKIGNAVARRAPTHIVAGSALALEKTAQGLNRAADVAGGWLDSLGGPVAYAKKVAPYIGGGAGGAALMNAELRGIAMKVMGAWGARHMLTPISAGASFVGRVANRSIENARAIDAARIGAGGVVGSDRVKSVMTQIASDPSTPSNVAEVARKLAKFDPVVRGVKSTSKGMLADSAFETAVGLLAEQDLNQIGGNIGEEMLAGGVMGSVGHLNHELSGGAYADRVKNEIALGWMAHKAKSPEALAAWESLSPGDQFDVAQIMGMTMGNATVEVVGDAEFRRRHGGQSSAGSHSVSVDQRTGVIMVNADARRTAGSTIRHEFGHELARAVIPRAQREEMVNASVDPADIQKFKDEYVKKIVDDQGLPDTPENRENALIDLENGRDGVGWAYDELFSEVFVNATRDGDVPGMRRSLAAKRLYLKAVTGADVETPKQATMISDSVAFKDNPDVTAALAAYVTDYVNYGKRLASEGTANAPVSRVGDLNAVVGNPAYQTHFNPSTGKTENAFVRQDDDGNNILKTPKEIRAETKAYRKAVMDGVKSRGPLLNQADDVVGPRLVRGKSGPTEISGRRMSLEFYESESVPQHYKNVVREVEKALMSDEAPSLEIHYQELAGGKREPDNWAGRVRRYLGDAAASKREIRPLSIKSTKNGNLIVTALDVSAMEHKALEYADTDKLEIWENSPGDFISDVFTVFDAWKRGEDTAQVVGKEKRDFINVFLGQISVDATQNPNQLDNPQRAGRGPRAKSLVKSFRIDRVGEAKPSGRAGGVWFDYGKFLRNLSPGGKDAIPKEHGGGLKPSTFESLGEVGYDPSASEGTQITSTRNTYKRIADERVEPGQKVLDFSAGRGAGTSDLREAGVDIDGYEPFSNPDTRLVDPEFENAADIPKGTYDVIINNAVLNVVPEDAGREILGDIYSALAPGGRAYVSVMGWNNIKGRLDNPKTKLVGPREVVTSKGTFQKGYTRPSLEAMIKDVLPDAEITPTKYGDIGFEITKPRAGGSFSPGGVGKLRSPLVDALEGSGQRRLTGDQLRALIERDPAARREAEATNPDLLKGGQDAVDLDDLEVGRMKLGEKVIGAADHDALRDGIERYISRSDLIFEDNGPTGHSYILYGDDPEIGADPEDHIAAQGSYKDIANELGMDEADFLTDSSEYEEYAMQGGRDYRETLVTLPPKGDVPNKMVVEFASRDDRDDFIGDANLLGEADFSTPSDTKVVFAPSSDKGARGLSDLAHSARAMDLQSIAGTGEATFQSSHWDEPNVLVHVRSQELDTADGTQATVVEEVQSDWHQTGRKRGYGDSPRPEGVFVAGDIVKVDGMYRTISGTFENSFLVDGSTDRIANSDAVLVTPNPRTKAVPEAPFKSTKEWAVLGMKRALVDAVANGSSHLAWTPGDAQVERYSLAKKLNAIEYYESDVDGRFHIDAYAKNLETGEDGKNVLAKASYTAEELPDVVGKELAEAIINGEGSDSPVHIDEGRRIEGKDLEVGGEGMRDFYDKIIPRSVIPQIQKELGVPKSQRKLEVIDVEHDGGSTKMLGMPITPEIAEKVRGNGLTMFSPGGAKGDADAGGTDAGPTIPTVLQDVANVRRRAEAAARHSELEEKNEAGTITPEETAEAQAAVDAAAAAALPGEFIDASNEQTRAISSKKQLDSEVAYYEDKLKNDLSAEKEAEKIAAIGPRRKALEAVGLDPDDHRDRVTGLMEHNLRMPGTEEDIRAEFQSERKHARAGIEKAKQEYGHRGGDRPTSTEFETGVPFHAKVHHGTPMGQITEFDGDALGGYTGAPSAGEAHFFAGSPTVAQTYFEDGSSYLQHKGFLKLTPEQKTALVDSLREEGRDLEDYSDAEVEQEVLDMFDEDEVPDYDTSPPDNVLHEVFVGLENPLVVDQLGSYREDSFYDTLIKAKEGGHDGVVFANTTDSGPAKLFNSFSEPTNVIAVLAGNESQIKSAEPFTGVPLDQRFDPTKQDIRFSPGGVAAKRVGKDDPTIPIADQPDLVPAPHTDIPDTPAKVSIPLKNGGETSFKFDPDRLVKPPVKSLFDTLLGKTAVLLEADRHHTLNGDMGGPLHPWLRSNQVTVKGPDGKLYKPVWANMAYNFVTTLKNRTQAHKTGRALVHVMDKHAHKSNKRILRTISEEIDRAGLDDDQKRVLTLAAVYGERNNRISDAKKALRKSKKALNKAAKKGNTDAAAKAEKGIADANTRIAELEFTPAEKARRKLFSLYKTARTRANNGGNPANAEKRLAALMEASRGEDFRAAVGDSTIMGTGDTFNGRGKAVGEMLGLQMGDFNATHVLDSTSDFEGAENLDIVAAIELSQDPDFFAVYTGDDPSQEKHMSPAEREARDQLLADPEFVPHESYDWVQLGPADGDNFVASESVKPEDLFPDYRERHPKDSVKNGSPATVAGAMKKFAGVDLVVGGKDAAVTDTRFSTGGAVTPSGSPAAKTSSHALLHSRPEDSPVPLGEKRDNIEVAEILQDLATEELGEPIVSADITDEQVEALALNFADEAQTALESSNKDAGTWYTEAVERAIKITERLWPEMTSPSEVFGEGQSGPENAKVVLATAMAHTSQNLTVDQNVRYAVEQFEHFREHGRFNTDENTVVYGDKAASIRGNLELANSLIDTLGLDGFRAFTDRDFTTGDLNKWLAAKGVQVRSEKTGKLKPAQVGGWVTNDVKGSAVFGPKIGQGFFQNLRGNLDPVTVDLWFRRTWGRLTGQVIKAGASGTQLGALLKSTEGDTDLPPRPAFLEGAALEPNLTKAGVANKKHPDTVGDDLISAAWENRKELVAWAKKLDSRWQKEFKALKDKGLTNKQISARKPKWALAANVAIGAFKPIDSPTDHDRAAITRTVIRAREMLAERGIDVTNADLQAILWYPEKDLWDRLRGKKEKLDKDGQPVNRLNTSYDEEMRKVAEARGIDVGDISAGQ